MNDYPKKTNPEHLIERLESIDDPRLKIGVVLTSLNEDGSRDGPFSDSIIIDKEINKFGNLMNLKVSRVHAACIEKFYTAPAEVYARFETFDLYDVHISRYGINLTGYSGNPNRRMYYISDNSCVDIFAMHCRDCGEQSIITSQDNRSYFPDGNYSNIPNQCPECNGKNTDIIKTNLKSRESNG